MSKRTKGFNESYRKVIFIPIRVLALKTIKVIVFIKVIILIILIVINY